MLNLTRETTPTVASVMEIFIETTSVEFVEVPFAELGDANVETTSLVLKKDNSSFSGVFINLTEVSDKDPVLLNSISDFKIGKVNANLFLKNSLAFTSLPNSIIGYNWDDYLINLFSENTNLVKSNLQARDGHNLVSNDHFRL
jgi:hypothetical protein